MKKNLLKIYESFFDDLDKLNKNLNKEDKENDEFGAVNGNIYDEHNYILSPDRNPEFFYALCEMCKGIFDNKIGFTQEDLNQIKDIYSNIYGNSCFKNVISLDELQYFHNLEIINPYCFFDCRKLKSIIFPENLETIKMYSFANCTSLKEIKFNENINNIGTCAFYNCKKLREVIFPNKIIKLDFGSFNICKKLEEIVISERFKYKIQDIFSDVNLSKVNITYI